MCSCRSTPIRRQSETQEADSRRTPVHPREPRPEIKDEDDECFEVEPDSMTSSRIDELALRGRVYLVTKAEDDVIEILA